MSGLPYKKLADLLYQAHVHTAVRDPRLAAAVERLRRRDESLSNFDFRLPSLTGENWSLKRLRGKVVLVNFWATWCPPCRAEMPELDALYREFRARGLVVLGISFEEERVIRKFAGQNAVVYPILMDPRELTKKAFGVGKRPLRTVLQLG